MALKCQIKAVFIHHKYFEINSLLLKADHLAAGLTALGLKPGDRVGIWAPNCPEWIITQFAAARGGFILVS